MADTVKQVVETQLTLKDEASSKAKDAKGAFDALGASIMDTVSKIAPLTNAIAGIATQHLSVDKVMKAGSEFENLTIGLAQTMQFMGAGGDTFKESMKESSKFLNKIVADAGPLPGNALDYANAMQLAGASAQNATGSFKKGYELVRDMTAVSISLGGNAQLASTELNRMLNPVKGMMHETGDFNQKILAAVRQLPGYATLTAKEFNKFDLDKRTSIITKAVGQYKDMVQESSSSWDAIKGATEANVSLLTKTAGAPLFDAVKKGAQWLNEQLVDSEGNLGRIGILISGGVSKGLEMALKYAGQIKDEFVHMIKYSEVLQTVWGAADRLTAKFAEIPSMAQSVFTGSASQNAPNTEDLGSALIALLTGGPMQAVLVGGFSNFMKHTEAVSEVVDRLERAFDSLLGLIQPVIAIFAIASDLIGSAMAELLPPIMHVVNVILDVVVPFIASVVEITTIIYEQIKPSLDSLFESVGQAVDAIAELAGPLLSMVGNVIMWLYEKLSYVLIPIITTLADVISGVVGVIVDIIKAVVSLINKLPGVNISMPGSVGQPSTQKPGMLQNIADFFSGIGKKDRADKVAKSMSEFFFGKDEPDGKGRAQASAGSARGGGGRVVQDFRFSRFDISQKFAEGFDPDRIALAFARDVEGIGEKRLQSGFEPLFGVR